MKSGITYSAGIDIGGTFTDIVLAGSDGSLTSRKTLSTPDDYGRGIAAALGEGLASIGALSGAVTRVVHATTVATNAVLEGKGARTALVTTKGFRDVLEMRRLRIPEMYALNYPKPDPLVPRRLRLEVTERLGPAGQVRIPLDEDTVRAAADRLAGTDIESIAISLLHSYSNSIHEYRVAEILRAALPDDVFISCSSDILPVIREYERTSTTVINAYLGPALRRYFASLSRHLAEIGVAAPLQVMKSDGGVMTVAAAGERPAYIVESGPAAGVIGAARMSGDARPADYITLDMGGTTVKAAIVEGGAVAKTGDYEVGAGINLSSKLVMGGGYALKLPVIDVSEIGAGGGSLVSIDAGGLVRVGPESAGAMPGPVAYDAGGTQATFTDAVLALGYLNPGHLVGGGLKLAAAKARAALDEQVARPLGKDLLDAAHGIFQVACGTMVRAVKAVSTYRGRDPRDFALFAFGGNGPVVAAEIAGLLEMDRIVVPPHPGVFSAHGLLMSNVEHEITQAFLTRLSATTLAEMAARFEALEARLGALMADEGYEPTDYATVRMADLRYAGQAHELTLDAGAPGDLNFAALAEGFGAEHERTYGHRAEAEEVECVTLRVRGTVGQAEPVRASIASLRAMTSGAAPSGTRTAYFGPVTGQVETPVIGRLDLEGADRAGPLIIEEYDSTCVVPPGWRAALDEGANIVLTREGPIVAATGQSSDPITLEVVKNALSSIADEMALVILRTAYSSIVRDSMDYSTGVCDRDGKVVAHGLTMALHLGSFPDAMIELTKQYAGDIHPGDIFIFNDPYVAGGMHLPDVYIIKPIFHDGILEGYAATLVHQIDVGGIAPGSTAVYAREIFQEGLRIPILKLYDRGQPNETLFKIMHLNTRVADKLAGDMRAQVAACNTAEQGFIQLVARYGSGTFRAVLADLHDYAERVTRAEIAALPDGRWTFTDYMDGLGEDPEPIPLEVAIEISGDEMVVDWAGSSPQVPGAINCPAPFVKSAVHLVLKCIATQEIPNFEGFVRPLDIRLPAGTIVNPTPPAACAARAIVGWRAIDVLLGVFAQIVPERVPAAGEGGVTFPAISGVHEGRPYVCSETLAGAWGAMPDRDGMFGIPNPGGNLTNQPVEMIEALHPIEVQKYGMVENSGGPGKFRGAPAFIRQYRFLGDETVIVMRSDRRRFLPYGLGGGCPGTPSWNIIDPDGAREIVPVMPMDALRLGRDAVFCHISAGGAGYGDPLARGPALVLDDVIEERFTLDYARRVYGAVIDPARMTVDAEATVALRAELAEARRAGEGAQPEYLKIFLEPLGITDFALSGERIFEARIAPRAPGVTPTR